MTSKAGDARGSPASWIYSPSNHGLRDSRYSHAGARYDHRQCCAALYARQRLGKSGRNRLGADLLYRRGGDHDAANRLPGRKVWTEASFSRLGCRLHLRLDPVRLFAVLGADRTVPGHARLVWRGARAAFPNSADEHQSEGAARICNRPMGRCRDGRARSRAGARRLADADVWLALCFLYQRARRLACIFWVDDLFARDDAERHNETGLVRIWHTESGTRGNAGDAGSRAGAGLVRLW